MIVRAGAWRVASALKASMAIEYDPTAIQGKIAADFLVIGWLRGEGSAPRDTVVAKGIGEP